MATLKNTAGCDSTSEYDEVDMMEITQQKSCEEDSYTSITRCESVGESTEEKGNSEQKKEMERLKSVVGSTEMEDLPKIQNEMEENLLKNLKEVDEKLTAKGDNSLKNTANGESTTIRETPLKSVAIDPSIYDSEMEQGLKKDDEDKFGENVNDKLPNNLSVNFVSESASTAESQGTSPHDETSKLTEEISKTLLKTPIVVPCPQNIVFIKLHDNLLDFYCQICKRDFSSKSALNEHMIIHSGEQPFSCDICHKKFNKKGNLTRHLNVHGGEKKHSCGICGKGYNHACSLKDHMKRHTGERPHECPICQKRFAEKCNLKRHIEWHSGIKSHECNVCGKTFYDVGNLSKHARVHTGERPYECGICGKRFRYPNTLQRHERIHTGDAPFVCPVCCKAFFSNAELHNHSVIHTGIKRFKCDVCGKGFKRNHHLTQHTKTHTGEKPYSCDVCGGKFVQQSGLRKHMRTFHPDVPTRWQDLPTSSTDTTEDTLSQNVEEFVSENGIFPVKLELVQ